MGVAIETALRWEQDYDYQIPKACDFPPAFREVVDYHFAIARTKDWNTRLGLYQAIRECRVRDLRKYGQYQWAASADHKVNPDVKLDTFALYRPEQAETKFSTSYRLRSTIEICRERRSGEFHGFMCLPVEVRDFIYSHALCKGKVIVPNSRDVTGDVEPVKHYEGDDGYCYGRYRGLKQKLLEMNCNQCKSSPLGLVQGVSRAVHDEAARIFFGRNQLIFPAGRFQRPTYCNLLDRINWSSEADFSRDLENRTNNAPLLRDVSYTFDMRDHPGDDYANLHSNFDLIDRVSSSMISPRDALQILHDQKTFALEVDWVERIDCIKRMTLDRLVLDTHECYCAIGCCRKTEWVIDRFLHKGPPPGTTDTEDNAYCTLDWVSRPPLVIEVLGFVNGIELQKLRWLPDSKIRRVPYVQDKLEDGMDHNEHMGPAMFLA